MELIWEELGPKIETLFQMGRSGVVAALIAASERLQIHENKVCISVAFCIMAKLNMNVFKILI